MSVTCPNFVIDPPPKSTLTPSPFPHPEDEWMVELKLEGVNTFVMVGRMRLSFLKFRTKEKLKVFNMSRSLISRYRQ